MKRTVTITLPNGPVVQLQCELFELPAVFGALDKSVPRREQPFDVAAWGLDFVSSLLKPTDKAPSS